MNLLLMTLRILSQWILAAVYLYSLFLRIIRKEKRVIPYSELQILIENYNGAKPPEILYFGDSVLLRVSRNDIEKKTLGQIFTQKVSDRYRVASFAHTAYHMLIYRELVRAFYRTTHRPKIVLLPVNLRSFSPQWDYNPSWQFWDEIKASRDYWLKSKITAIFEDKEKTPNKTISWLYETMPVYYPEAGLKTIRYFRDIIRGNAQNEAQRVFRLRNIFCFHYMHPLVDSHRKLAALIEIFKILNEMGVYVVAYVTPVNWQAGMKYIGSTFVDRIKTNVDLIKTQVVSAYPNSLVNFSDFSLLLDSDCFFNEDDPTEHLNEKGRGVLVNHLEDLIPTYIDSRGAFVHARLY